MNRHVTKRLRCCHSVSKACSPLQWGINTQTRTIALTAASFQSPGQLDTLKDGSLKISSLRSDHSIVSSTPPPPSPFTPATVMTTIYRVPSLEPHRFKYYPANYLYLPLRRDILHKAVVYEGDMTRSGTASTKWRDEIHGSGRKIRPQKGLGMARLGNKKSPILRGGGVAFGPKPRDFSTDLPRKMYDLAWRTALSYRYRRGELVVVNSNLLDIKGIQKAFNRNGWEQKKGRDLIITNAYLKTKAGKPERKTKVEEGAKVDVKDILESKRLIIDEGALDEMLRRHQSDLLGPNYQQLKP